MNDDSSMGFFVLSFYNASKLLPILCRQHLPYHKLVFKIHIIQIRMWNKKFFSLSSLLCTLFELWPGHIGDGTFELNYRWWLIYFRKLLCRCVLHAKSYTFYSSEIHCNWETMKNNWIDAMAYRRNIYVYR